MKKIFAVLLVGLMAVSVAACSNSNNNTNSGSNQQSSVVSEASKLAEITKTDNTKDDYLTDTKLYNCLYKKTTEDNVHITFGGNIEANGSTMSIDVNMQKQGENTYMSTKMMGMNMTQIQKDGYLYKLNTANKTYTKTKSENSSSDSEVSDSISSTIGSLKDTKFIENGLSKEEGTTDYEKYSASDATITCYFDGDNVKYIDVEPDTKQEVSAVSGVESQKMRLNISVTNDIDAKLFEIPEGYTLEEDEPLIMTDDSVSASSSGLSLNDVQ